MYICRSRLQTQCNRWLLAPPTRPKSTSPMPDPTMIDMMKAVWKVLWEGKTFSARNDQLEDDSGSSHDCQHQRKREQRLEGVQYTARNIVGGNERGEGAARPALARGTVLRREVTDLQFLYGSRALRFSRSGRGVTGRFGLVVRHQRQGPVVEVNEDERYSRSAPSLTSVPNKPRQHPAYRSPIFRRMRGEPSRCKHRR